MIDVDAADIAALLLGGEWVNVHDVEVASASFTVGPTTTYGVGAYVAATVQGGPHNGDRIVAPLDAVEALRVNV
jgi:hypothetical protein